VISCGLTFKIDFRCHGKYLSTNLKRAIHNQLPHTNCKEIGKSKDLGTISLAGKTQSLYKKRDSIILMDLRELKRDVTKLDSIENNITKFQENWLKPFHKNNNTHVPFLKDLDPALRKELNQRLASLQQDLREIKAAQIIHDKLQRHAHNLIELKLTTFNGDHKKSRMISKSFINDDVLNFRQTLTDVKTFDKSVKKLSADYDEINQLLTSNLSLEETLFFMDLPHKFYLYNLLQTAKEQQRIVRDLGRHLVVLTKQMSLKNKSRN
jgi:hypothetical protein